MMAGQSHPAPPPQSVSTIAMVHSVVVLNISDHWTRAQVQNAENTSQAVYGALLGKQVGRNIEIWNSFELKIIDEVDGLKQLIIDQDYFAQRGMLYKETFAELEFLGFYVTGDHDATTDDDVRLLKQARPHNESPFLLKLNAQSPVLSDKLAISLFDTSVDPGNENQLIFQPIPVKIVSELAEQIGLDHVAHCSAKQSTAGGPPKSTACKQLGSLFGALDAFIQGLTIAHEYIKAVQAGQIERDDKILAEIQKLCLKLSTLNDDELPTAKENANKENMQMADHKLLVLLTALCASQGCMFQLLEKVDQMAPDFLRKSSSEKFKELLTVVRKSDPTGGNIFAGPFF